MMRQDLVRRVAVVEERVDAARRVEHTAMLTRLWERDPAGATAVIVWCYLRRHEAVDTTLRQAMRWLGHDAPVPAVVASSWAHAHAVAAAWTSNGMDAAPESIRQTVDGALVWLGLGGDGMARATIHADSRG